MGGPASSTAVKICIQTHERTAISMALHPPKVWEQFADGVCSILKRTHLENFFHHINNLHQNIKFTAEEESNGELAFLDTWVATEDENNIVYEIDCSNCNAVYFVEFKHFLNLLIFRKIKEHALFEES